MTVLASSLIDGEDFEPGTDCDGITSYEPNGRPSSGVVGAIRFEINCDRYRVMTNDELVAAREKWVTDYASETMGDNFSTMNRMREDRRALNHVTEERRTVDSRLVLG